ncbi:hypothetical protein GOP47_0000020 [Adiantum capillus-veneris]|uniref:Uncharacterized protein n=1 Tax=Adiantum capillus-veneris TaxID=13818 RepID=A0A9D4VC90_ADICA|nr:hypothetical protein GOP47_0000020 [Adiantum capillus-veneris]
MESFFRGLHPSIQILVRAQAPQDLNTAITSVVNFESSYRCTYGPQLVVTPSPSYYSWLAPHSLPMSTPSLSLPSPSYVPQLQSTPPLQLPHVTPLQLQATPSPLSLPAPTPIIDTSSSSTSPHLLAPVPHAPKPFVTYPKSTSTTAPSMHHKGGDGYESTASNIGDLKDMMTNYMNQLNENMKAVTLDVNFLKRQQNLLSARRPEPNPTKIVCRACGVRIFPKTVPQSSALMRGVWERGILKKIAIIR